MPNTLGTTALAPASAAKQDLFGTRDREKERRLMAAVDDVNDWFTVVAIQFAGSVPDPRQPAPARTPRAAMTSSRYTTAWADLPVVRC